MLHFQEYQPACSQNETDKTMAQVHYAPTPNVTHVHKYTHCMYEYSGPDIPTRFALKQNLPFLNARNVGIAISQ